MEILEAILSAINWRDHRSGRSILRVRSGPRQFHTVTGTFAEIALGDRFRFEGRWVEHPRFGPQFECTQFEALAPDEGEIAERYLASGLFYGIGPATAKKIVERFGADRVLNYLQADPSAIGGLRGFGAVKAERFALEWKHHQALRSQYLELLRMHLPMSLVHRWVRTHGDKSLATLRMQPFKLTEEPWELGFQRADAIAKKLGLAPDAPERIRAALKFVLERASSDGHCYLPSLEAMQKAEELLQLDQETGDRLELALSEAVDREFLIQTEKCLYLPWLDRAERQVSSAIFQLLQRKSRPLNAKEEKSLRQLEGKLGLNYSEEQLSAIRMALEESLMILTGGPGTGKTSTLQGILAVLEAREDKVLLAAPTGRAARRMEEVSGRSASTLHRLLEYQAENHQCGRNADRPLECDVLVIDESSMVDLGLMEVVLDALPKRAALILVGDQNQLPSVGPGSVLGDLLELSAIPRVCLTQVFRQAHENDIPHNAQMILDGQIPRSLAKPTHFHLRKLNESKEMQSKILDLVCEDIPKHFQCDPLQDIQVLCPMKRGDVGIETLNGLMQERFLSQEKKHEGMPFRLGDKVMQTRNNYDKDVFNGDIGTVVDIDTVEQTLMVRFDADVEYSFPEAEELTLAYAITVHKSQGSEYPYVVLILDPDHKSMLQRRLLYTAVTRAKERLFIVCRGDALEMAVHNRLEKKRNSRLALRLGRHLDFAQDMASLEVEED